MRKPINRQLITKLHNQGLTGREIAKQLGCSEHTIIRARKQLGLNPGHNPMTPERRQRIQQMLEDGWSWKEIERTEGANWDTMTRHFPGTQWTRQQIINQSTITRHARENMRTTNYARKAA